MRAVHIGIGHDDDAVVAQFFQIEFFLADACAQRGNQRGDFLAGEHALKAGALHVQNLAFQRQDGLEFSVAALFGGTAGGIALHQIKLG